MKLDVIKIDKGYVAVSNGKIEVDDHYLSNNEIYVLCTNLNGKNSKKIIATDTTFKLEGVPQFELEETHIDYISWNEANKIFEKEEWRNPDLSNKEDELAVSAIHLGYKTALQNYQYTEENLRKAFEAGNNYGHNESLNYSAHHFPDEDEYIQSLKQPKELIGIEVETDDTGCTCISDPLSCCIHEPKIVNNKLIVTNYIYK